MSEHPESTPPPRKVEDEQSHASIGTPVERPGGGRTPGETDVDDDLGRGDLPGR